MHRHLRRALTVVAGLAAATNAARADLHAFAYHDVRDDIGASYDADAYAVSTQNLIAHLSWLRASGYTPVSVDDVIAAAQRRRTLPEKAVLLTFDDGLASAYANVFPILKLFGYPAVVSVVTDWIENPDPVDYGGRALDRSAFLTWDQLREMQASGLVEIASHSHDLHKGIPGNPQGNLQPAAVTRRYADRRYEDAAAYRQRIASDLARSAAVLEAELGLRPRVLTWPYGAYSRVGIEIAAEQGMSVTFGLGEALNRRLDPSEIRREVVTGNPDLEAFTPSLLYPPARPVMRAAQVDLDYVYDPDPAQQERNLGRLIERIHRLGISHVFLQAFADPDADGGAHAAYFPTARLPMRADLFNRAAWQLKTRAQVSVYAWLPLLSYVGDQFDPAWRVLQSVDGRRSTDPGAEPRLSPFHAEARARIGEIYRDLAIHASFDGILFHDDGRLNEREDASDAALAAYREAFGPDFTIEAALAEPGLAVRWARFKSRALVELSSELTEIVRRHRPEARTARNLFATALLDPDGERYLAQNFRDYLAAYDGVALMAMPALEGADAAEPFYEALVAAVSAVPGGLQRTLFELQTVDWRSGRPVPANALRDTMRWLQSLGVRDLGYYPDDFINDRPALESLRQGISLARFPRAEP